MPLVFEFTINTTFYVWSFCLLSSPYGILKNSYICAWFTSRKDKGVEVPLTFPNKDFFKVWNSGKENWVSHINQNLWFMTTLHSPVCGYYIYYTHTHTQLNTKTRI